MSLLRKIKINIDYLLGKANSSLYAPKYQSQKVNLREWQKRWEIYSDNGCGFIWYGYDSLGNIAEFVSEEAYIPEVFFDDVSNNKKLQEYFENLPSIYESQLPQNIRTILREKAEKDKDSISETWYPLKEAKRGIFIFAEVGDSDWYNSETFKNSIYKKNPQELLASPQKGLKYQELPDEIKEIIRPYKFENLRFSNCQFLDISKYFYCEE